MKISASPSERLLERDPSAALRLVAALWAFWFMSGHFREGSELPAAALERAPTEPTEAKAGFAEQGCSPRSR